MFFIIIIFINPMRLLTKDSRCMIYVSNNTVCLQKFLELLYFKVSWGSFLPFLLFEYDFDTVNVPTLTE